MKLSVTNIPFIFSQAITSVESHVSAQNNEKLVQSLKRESFCFKKIKKMIIR